MFLYCSVPCSLSTDGLCCELCDRESDGCVRVMDWIETREYTKCINILCIVRDNTRIVCDKDMRRRQWRLSLDRRSGPEDD